MPSHTVLIDRMATRAVVAALALPWERGVGGEEGEDAGGLGFTPVANGPGGTGGFFFYFSVIKEQLLFAII